MLREICDAWAAEISSKVPALSEAEVHLYASWSPEDLYVPAQGRAFAVYPEGDPEVRVGFTTQPADLVTTSFLVEVWEDATVESGRLQDDDERNVAWLALFEAVKHRFYVGENLQLGDAQVMDTHYLGASFGLAGGVRFFILRFAIRRPESWT